MLVHTASRGISISLDVRPSQEDESYLVAEILKPVHKHIIVSPSMCLKHLLDMYISIYVPNPQGETL